MLAMPTALTVASFCGEVARDRVSRPCRCPVGDFDTVALRWDRAATGIFSEKQRQRRSDCERKESQVAVSADTKVFMESAEYGPADAPGAWAGFNPTKMGCRQPLGS
jgi:hypothetical protein